MNGQPDGCSANWPVMLIARWQHGQMAGRAVQDLAGPGMVGVQLSAVINLQTTIITGECTFSGNATLRGLCQDMILTLYLKPEGCLLC